MVVPKSAKREQVLKLIEHKVALENRINDHGKILEANNVGMSGPLVDDSGYPRNDIDVLQVRQARNQIICLQNDLRELLKEIEKGLHEVHAETAADVSHEASTKMSAMEIDNTKASDENDIEFEAPLIAFVKVNLVSPGSPAEEAGIRLGDEILEFGTVNTNNFKALNQIADVVRHRQNQTVIVKVLRATKVHELNLVPKTWSGRGLLGCNIVLCDNIER